MREELTGQSSRQGKRGKPALFVLVISVGLMLASLTGLMLWQGARAPNDYDGKSRTLSLDHGTSAKTEPDAASSANSGGVPGGNPAYPQPSVRTATP